MYGCTGNLWNKGAMYYNKEEKLRDIRWKDNYVPYLIFTFFSFLFLCHLYSVACYLGIRVMFYACSVAE